MDGTKIAEKILCVRLFEMVSWYVRNSPTAWAMSIFFGPREDLLRPARRSLSFCSCSFFVNNVTKHEGMAGHTIIHELLSFFGILAARATFYFRGGINRLALAQWPCWRAIVCNLLSSKGCQFENVFMAAIGMLVFNWELLAATAAVARGMQSSVGAHLSCWSFISTDRSSAPGNKEEEEEETWPTW